MHKTWMLWLVLIAVPVQAEIYKCTDDSGRVGYSDKPCASAQNSESMVIEPAPVTAVESREMAAEREDERRRMSAERDRREKEKNSKRMADDRAEIKKIKSENYDPRKCSSARSKMAQMKQRDPLTYKLDLSYFEYEQMAILYCGN